MPFVRNYGAFVTKASIYVANGYAVIDSNYPSSVLIPSNGGIPSKSGGAASATINPTTGESEKPTEFVSDVEEYFNGLSSEEQAQMNAMAENGDFVATHKVNHAEEQEELRKESEEFVDLLNDLEVALTNLSDNQIEEGINATLKGTDSKFIQFHYRNENRRHEVSAFKKEGVTQTRWNGYCGPSAIAMIYAGLEGEYNGVRNEFKGNYDKVDLYGSNRKNYKSVPYNYYFNEDSYQVRYIRYYKYDFNPNDDRYKTLSQVSNKSYHPTQGDGGLYYDAAYALNNYARDGGSYAWDYDKALRYVSRGKYGIHYHWRWDTLVSYIYYSDMPATASRIAKKGEKGGHVRVAIGSSYNIKELYALVDWICGLEWRGWFNFKAKWCRQRINIFAYTDDHQIKVYDNGYDTEQNGYRPYWENTREPHNNDWIPFWNKGAVIKRK